MYLDIGKAVLSTLLLRTKVKCGLANIQDLRTNALEDRMESFVLSETLKVRSHSPIHPPIVNPKPPVSLSTIRRGKSITQR
jgi:hypothetical protein